MPVKSQDYYLQVDRIGWFDHLRLREKKVLMVGAGTLANWVLPHLVLNGVGTVLIVDRDIVQESDLPRSPLYRQADIGKAKAEVAAKRLALMNRDVRILAVMGDVAYDLGAGEFLRADVVVGAVDSRLARMHINKNAWAACVPYFDGGIDGTSLTGRVQAFFPPNSACLECAWYPEDYAQLEIPQPCNPRVPDHGAPTFSTIAAQVGAVLASEVLRFLLGMENDHREAYEIRYDLFSHAVIRTLLLRRTDCLHDHQTLLGEVVFLENAGMRLGDFIKCNKRGGALGVDFRCDVVTQLVCPRCGEQMPMLRTLRVVTRKGHVCPACRSTMTVARTQTCFSDKELQPFLDTRLDDIGFPGGHLLSLRGVDGKQRHYELPGSRLAEVKRDG
ncbi:MAG: ThiF family adenylyltransferase [Candidatus Hadarchaeum sp.]